MSCACVVACLYLISMHICINAAINLSSSLMHQALSRKVCTTLQKSLTLSIFVSQLTPLSPVCCIKAQENQTQRPLHQAAYPNCSSLRITSPDRGSTDRSVEDGGSDLQSHDMSDNPRLSIVFRVFKHKSDKYGKNIHWFHRMPHEGKTPVRPPWKVASQFPHNYNIYTIFIHIHETIWMCVCSSHLLKGSSKETSINVDFAQLCPETIQPISCGFNFTQICPEHDHHPAKDFLAKDWLHPLWGQVPNL